MGDIDSVEVKFVARQAKYVVPDVETIISRQSTCKELMIIVNKLLNPDVLPENYINFEFLFLGDILSGPLEIVLQDKNVQRDAKITIEFYEKLPAPSVGELLLHDDWVACVQALNEDLILTGCYDGSVKLWSANGKLLKDFAAHAHAVKGVAWLEATSKEKMFVTGSDDGTCILWSWIVTQEEIKELKNFTSEKKQEIGEIRLMNLCPMPAINNKLKNYCLQNNVQTVAASPSKTFFASGSCDGIINIWSVGPSINCVDEPEEERRGRKRRKVDDKEEKLPIQTFDGKDAHANQVSQIEWVSDDKICSSSWDHSIKFWDIKTCQVESSITGSKIFLDHSYSHLNGTIVAGSVDRHIRLYDPRIATGSVVNCTFTSHTGWVSCVKWSPNEENLFISGSYDFLDPRLLYLI